MKTVSGRPVEVWYLDQTLCQMPIAEIKPLHLTREWNRLVERGGRHRRTKEPRSLSNKTVRNIAGVLSSAFKRAIKWGLVTSNPVAASEPPVPKKTRGKALTTAQVQALVAAATEPWCLGTFIEVCAATGARRGEALALRCADIQDGRAVIARSLTQTRAGLQFKCTKTEDSERPATLPASALRALEAHRKPGRGASWNHRINSSSAMLHTRFIIGEETLSSTSAFNFCHPAIFGDSGEAERSFRKESERHSGMNPNTIGA